MMLKIDLHTPLGPLVLRPSSTSISGAGEERTIPVVGILNIRANKRTHIGGIRLGWKVTLEKRNTVATSAKSKNRDGWGPAEVIKSFELDVEGEMWVEEGQTQLNCVMVLPFNLPPTRTTSFDRVQHQFTALILDTSPCYDRVMSASSSSRGSTSSSTLFDGPPASGFASSSTSIHSQSAPYGRQPQPSTSLMGRLKSLVQVATPNNHHSHIDDAAKGILARCSTPVVVYTQIADSMHHTDFAWSHRQALAGYGSIDLELSSSELALSSPLALNLSLSNLHEDLTIHAISIDLYQKTATKTTCDSTSCGIDCDRDRDRERVSIDKYNLYQAGTAIQMLAARPRPKAGAYLWRGARALELSAWEAASASGASGAKPPFHSPPRATRPQASHPTILSRPADSEVSSSQAGFIKGSNGMSNTFQLNHRLRLPSHINGLSPTFLPHPASTAPNDVLSSLATISHRLELTILYSVLNENFDGQPISPPPSQPADQPISPSLAHTTQSRNRNPSQNQNHNELARSTPPPEGAIRRLTISIPLHVSSCMSPLSLKPPPEYSSSEIDLPKCPVKRSDQTPAKFLIAGGHYKTLDSTSKYSSGGVDVRWMRPVRWDSQLVNSRIDDHWEENGGRCLCFANGEQAWVLAGEVRREVMSGVHQHYRQGQQHQQHQPAQQHRKAST